MTNEQHEALVRSLRNELSTFLAQHMGPDQVAKGMRLADAITERARNDGADFGAVRERTAAQLRTGSKKRHAGCPACNPQD